VRLCICFLLAGVLGASQEIETAPVSIEQVRGYVAYPKTEKRVPAVLILGGGVDPPAQKISHDMAQHGFAALALDHDPDHPSGMSPLVEAVIGGRSEDRADAGIAWLIRQPFVDSRKIGAFGWGTGVAAILHLARQGKLGAGVLAGEAVCAQADQWPQLAGTRFLVIVGSSRCNPSNLRQRPDIEFQTAQGAAFPEDAGEQSVYEFLAGALKEAPVDSTGQGIARIVDVMRVIDSDDGVKGRLAKSLALPPTGDQQWEQARSAAAILAESGNLLLRLPAPKGSDVEWRRQAIDFRAAAGNLLRAVEKRDFAAAQNALRILPKSCASCHAVYR
jgi:Dienelactone hydrolase family